MAVRQDIEKFRRPELFFSELLRKFARAGIQESSDSPLVLQRALVLAADPVGGVLENPDGSGEFEMSLPNGQKKIVPAASGPRNPPNSIRARILTGGADRFFSDESVLTFWPLFGSDHIAIPTVAGEHVYVMFEDRGRTHGLWVCRVSGHEGANFFAGRSSYRPIQGRSAVDSFPDTSPSDDYPTDDDFAAETVRTVDPAAMFGD